MKYLTILFILSVLTGCYSKEPEITGLEGKPLPSFKLFLEDSTTNFDMQMIPKGKPVVLLYFGPHCPYSRAQVEEIVNHIELLKDIHFYFFTTWSFRELKLFCTEYQLKKYPNIVAGVDYTNFFANYIGAEGVPYMAIYGRDKLLRKAFIGNVKSKQIKYISTK
jgi:hypothetical protein